MNTGTLRLYANGTWVGAVTNLTWALQQDEPLVFGGHNSGSNLERCWNGRLTDAVLFTNALSGTEISRLATRSVTRFGGRSATNTVAVNVVPPNTAPTLAAISNRTISAGFTLVITNVATDSDVPPQALTTELSSFGVRTIDVEAADDLCVPAMEYHYLDDWEDPPVLYSQIPAGFAGGSRGGQRHERLRRGHQ